MIDPNNIQVPDEEQVFIDAADAVYGVVEGMDYDLAFVACGSVMLDALEGMLASGDGGEFILPVANQVYVEFVTLMNSYGFDLGTSKKET
jgi:hypothetical protein